MALTENELAVAYCKDTVLGREVANGRMSGEEWDMYYWYAVRLGVLNTIALPELVSSDLILGFRIVALKAMLSHNRFGNTARAQEYLNQLYAQCKELLRLQLHEPSAYQETDRAFVLGCIPTDLTEAYLAGRLTCEDLARAKPRMLLPFIADL